MATFHSEDQMDREDGEAIVQIKALRERANGYRERGIAAANMGDGPASRRYFVKQDALDAEADRLERQLP
jgi:hypothetical protein